MKQRIKPSILPGFMELSPKEQGVFEDMLNKMIKSIRKMATCLWIHPL